MIITNSHVMSSSGMVEKNIVIDVEVKTSMPNESLDKGVLEKKEEIKTEPVKKITEKENSILKYQLLVKLKKQKKL